MRFIFPLVSLCILGANSESIGNKLRTHAHDHAGLTHDVHSASFGTYMQRIYITTEDLPVGEQALSRAGWRKHGCDSNLGWAWTKESGGLTVGQPLVMYTNAAGQPSGVGTIIRKFMPAEQEKWTTSNSVVPVKGVSDTYWHVDVAFRTGNQCVSTGTMRAEEIGDKLTLNPGGASMDIPISESVAAAGGWQRGSCFDGMGWHYFLNTAGVTFPMKNSQTWRAGDVLPIVAMYHGGSINAIFFNSPTSQATPASVWPPSLGSSNKWEPSTLEDPNMCKNTCDGSCAFDKTGLNTKEDTNAWSTMHIYFNDVDTVECSAGLDCFLRVPFIGGAGCCESDVWAAERVAAAEAEQSSGSWVWISAGCGSLAFLAGAIAVVTKKRSSARVVQVSEMVA